MTDADAEPLRDALLQVVQSHRRATLRFCPTYAATLLQLYGSMVLLPCGTLLH
jgi:hypothetical protein